MASVLSACTPAVDPDSANRSNVATSTSVSTAPQPAASSASALPSPSTSIDAPGASAQNASPSASTATGQGGEPQKLDSLAATRAARAKGMKVDLFVPNPISCPSIPKPKIDVTSFYAQGKLAGLIIDMDAFVRPDFGVPEAIAMFGEPVLCNDGAIGGYLDMHLAPRDPSVLQVTVETNDGELIGLIVEFEKTVTVDVRALEARYGKSQRRPGPHDSFEAGSDAFSTKGQDFHGYYSFAHRSHKDPINARVVHQIIYRRSATIEILPDAFHSPSEVARLVALALRPKAPEALAFAGTLGLYKSPVNRRVVFDTSPLDRNVQSAWIVVRDDPNRHFIQVVEVKFTAPIAGNLQEFSRAFSTQMNVLISGASDEGKRKRLDIVDNHGKRGHVLLDLSATGLRGIEVVRADGN